MKRFLSLLLCLLLSFFTVARAMKPAQTPTAGAPSPGRPKGEKVDAETLSNDARIALALRVKAARSVVVSESVSEREIRSDESDAKNVSFDMFAAEQKEIAAETDADEEVTPDDDESMEDATDDESEDMGDDDAGETSDDDTADDDGGAAGRRRLTESFAVSDHQ